MRALALAAVAWALAPLGAIAQPLRPDPPPLSKLPEGSLQLFGGNAKSVNFFDRDRSVRTGDLADVWYLRVYAEPVKLGSGKVEVVEYNHESIDCLRRTVTTLSVEGFDAEGQRVVWLPAYPAETIAPNSTPDLLAKLVCEGFVLPPTNTVTGYRAAVARTPAILSANSR